MGTSRSDGERSSFFGGGAITVTLSPPLIIYPALTTSLSQTVTQPSRMRLRALDRVNDVMSDTNSSSLFGDEPQ